jgi:hypothetical protein
VATIAYRRRQRTSRSRHRVEIAVTPPAPYYVLVSTDDDASDPAPTSIMSMEALHANHPGNANQK